MCATCRRSAQCLLLAVGVEANEYSLLPPRYVTKYVIRYVIKGEHMEKNVGGADRVVRIVAGIGIIAAGAVYQSWWGIIGVVPLATATLGWCPPYSLLGINTCGIKKSDGAS